MNYVKRYTTLLLAIALLLPGLLALPYLARAGKHTPATITQPLTKVSDPDTSNAMNHFNATTLENGRLWTDKTVSDERAYLYDEAGHVVDHVDAQDNEFLVTLSALSQSFSIDTMIEPTDVVFVLDISGSMVSNTLDDGRTRAAVMVDALNQSIQILMAANSHNRFAVVAYGGHPVRDYNGSTINGSRIVPVMGLGHHLVSDGHYFAMLGSNQITVSSEIPDSALTSPANRTFTVEGGTPTQRGIYAGAQVLMNNSDTSYTPDHLPEVSLTRKPTIILLTDGEPTFAFSDYTLLGNNPAAGGAPFDSDIGHNSGNGTAPELASSTLTVLSAAYWKQRVHDHYYGADDHVHASGFYTIGLDISGVYAPAAMDPHNFAQHVNQTHLSTTYNMRTVLQDFVNLAGGTSIPFPALNRNSGSARSIISVQNPSNFITDYNYTDGYFPAQSAEELADAFTNIALQIVSHGGYTTEVGSGNPDFVGFLTFSDVLGQHMSFKGSQGFWLNNEKHTGNRFAEDLSSPSSVNRDAFITILLQRLQGITTHQAESLLDSNIAAGKAGGGLYYLSDDDYSNKLTFYGDERGDYISNYFDSSGQPLEAPPTAKCIVEWYTVESTASNSVTGYPTNLMNVSFNTITALEDGTFICAQSDGDELDRHLTEGQQIVQWYIPASLLPLRTASPQFDEEENLIGLGITETAPAHFIFAVGLGDNLTYEDLSDEYKATHKNPAADAYWFYTNDWNDSDIHNLSMAFFNPNSLNPYYHYIEDESDEYGRIPLFVQSGGSYVPASSFQEDSDYFTRSIVFDFNTPGYLREVFIPVNPELTDIQGKDGVPYVLPGAVKQDAFEVGLKQPNATDTRPFITEKRFHTVSGERVQLHIMDNNGRLELPFDILGAPGTEPPDPGEPNGPGTETPPPLKPETGGQGGTGGPAGTPSTNLPKTGDNTALTWIALLGLLLAGATSALTIARKRTN